MCRRLAYIALLLVHMTNLEPNVGIGKGVWGIAKNTLETIKGLRILPLLFVDYAEAEENLICLIKI